MNIALWVAQAILAIKLITTSFSHGPRQSQPDMHKAMEKMGSGARAAHSIVSVLTFLAAVGLILPGLVGLQSQLVVWAAVLSGILLLASIYFHVRFRDNPKVFVSVVLVAFSIFIVYGRQFLAP